MVEKKAYIVVGLGYGDEGKGITTDYLCSLHTNSIVIRFNGGHQAGHTVYSLKGKQHVFSSFGAGTMRGIPTYWSSNCTFSPIHFLDELRQLPISPKIYIDLNCPVTTHYDVLYNRTLESSRGTRRYGSCGVGFGATIDRHRLNGPTILFRDLFGSVKTIITKLKMIRDYYRFKINTETDYNFNDFQHNIEDQLFLKALNNIEKIKNKILFSISEADIFNVKTKWDTYIFEGAQGILLDQQYGEKPHITKSNTTSRNAIEMLTRQENAIKTEIYYVTRAYHTRHGAGPFRGQGSLQLVNNQSETNTYNKYQQEFKSAYIDIDLVNYALQCDKKYSEKIDKNLVITCLDHLPDKNIPYYFNDKMYITKSNDLYKLLNCIFKQVLFSHSKYSEDFVRQENS